MSEVGSSTSIVPAPLRSAGWKPLSRNMSIMRWLSGSTSATNVAIAVGARDGREALQEQGADTMALRIVRDRERHLGPVASERRVHPVADEPRSGHGHDVDVGRVEEQAQHPVGVRRRAEEPQTHVVALEIVVERVQRSGVGRLGAAERHDGAVTQDLFVDHAATLGARSPRAHP